MLRGISFRIRGCRHDTRGRWQTVKIPQEYIEDLDSNHNKKLPVILHKEPVKAASGLIDLKDLQSFEI